MTACKHGIIREIWKSLLEKQLQVLYICSVLPAASFYYEVMVFSSKTLSPILVYDWNKHFSVLDLIWNKAPNLVSLYKTILSNTQENLRLS